MWPAALTRYVTGKSNLEDQLGLVPQDPHPPPQQPPPPPDSLMKSESDADASPALPNAKLETNTLVLVDSHAGHICAVSRSANRVRTSNFPEQLSHRYS
jgi:hypothetical protein